MVIFHSYVKLPEGISNEGFSNIVLQGHFYLLVLCKANMWEAEAPGEFCRYNYDFIDALHGDQFIYWFIYIYISGGLQHHVKPCHSWCLDGLVACSHDRGAFWAPNLCMAPVSTVDDADWMRMAAVWWMGRRHRWTWHGDCWTWSHRSWWRSTFSGVISNSSIAHFQRFKRILWILGEDPN